MVVHIPITWIRSSVVFSAVRIVAIVDCAVTIDRRIFCVRGVWIITLISMMIMVGVVNTRPRWLEVLSGGWELIVWVARTKVMVRTGAQVDSS